MRGKGGGGGEARGGEGRGGERREREGRREGTRCSNHFPGLSLHLPYNTPFHPASPCPAHLCVPLQHLQSGVIGNVHALAPAPCGQCHKGPRLKDGLPIKGIGSGKLLPLVHPLHVTRGVRGTEF